MNTSNYIGLDQSNFKDFEVRLLEKINSINKFLNHYEHVKRDPALAKALNEVRNILIESRDVMHQFFLENENFHFQHSIVEALKFTVREYKEELDQYRNIRKLILSEDKETLIRTVVDSLNKLISPV